MYIKYDDVDMMEFFEKEPIIVGEEDEGIFIFSIEDSMNFTMSLTVDTYKNTIEVSVLYNQNIIFTGEFNNIVEIRKSDSILVVDLKDGSHVLLKKYPCIGVLLEKE